MKKLAALLACFSFLYIVSCSSEKPTEPKLQESTINPNGDSELAIVMRHLHFEANRVKAQLESGEMVELDSLTTLIRLVETAEPTDGHVRDDEFMAFSNLLNKEMDKMHTDSNKVVEFNNIVSTCVSCHRNTCPGPIPKIKKLRIKEVAQNS